LRAHREAFQHLSASNGPFPFLQCERRSGTKQVMRGFLRKKMNVGSHAVTVLLLKVADKAPLLLIRCLIIFKLSNRRVRAGW
jgi:hypothetical protein